MVVALLPLADFSVQAQQDAQFSHYMFNNLYYSPGYAGMDPGTRATLITRKQWLGYQRNSVDAGGTSPTSTILTLNSRLPILKSRAGMGLNLGHDVAGPLTGLQAQLSAAYHIMLGGTNRLGIGARAGIFNQRINGDWYRVVNQTDPIYQDLVNAKSSQIKLDYAAGAFFNSEKLTVGLGFNHLSKSKFSYNVSNISSTLSNHMYVTGSYKIPMGNLDITPTAIVQSDFNQLSYALGPMFTYQKKYWLGVNARQSFAKKDGNRSSTFSNDDIFVLLGMNLMKNDALRIGYAIDLVTSGLRGKAATSHEIMLSYLVPGGEIKAKPVIHTPRHRQE